MEDVQLCKLQNTNELTNSFPIYIVWNTHFMRFNVHENFRSPFHSSMNLGGLDYMHALLEILGFATEI
jgi:hypothetical protein